MTTAKEYRNAAAFMRAAEEHLRLALHYLANDQQISVHIKKVVEKCERARGDVNARAEIAAEDEAAVEKLNAEISASTPLNHTH